ncbi:hypothetical protein BCR32DRAFT_288331 [Anaeromyces robustus]|uniref:Uncharacterized protein n=2 Tax=Anaeromyces robustus TaxID=1754192 RepID=A0A1Y1V098_9FUNG|nr:hypothetical protein BCR32DRAFT_288330 [Anaeromyces robustus]ORX43838.1 hypothetical protein BCR32DRAFT_288331 [Anaeromyces robustus]|eukprot:ORX43837.1 hypothetical protein BCR32DRAFT_288330 [Anaeromyces robustus]
MKTINRSKETPLEEQLEKIKKKLIINLINLFFRPTLPEDDRIYLYYDSKFTTKKIPTITHRIYLQKSLFPQNFNFSEKNFKIIKTDCFTSTDRNFTGFISKLDLEKEYFDIESCKKVSIEKNEIMVEFDFNRDKKYDHFLVVIVEDKLFCFPSLSNRAKLERLVKILDQNKPGMVNLYYKSLKEDDEKRKRQLLELPGYKINNKKIIINNNSDKISKDDLKKLMEKIRESKYYRKTKMEELYKEKLNLIKSKLPPSPPNTPEEDRDSNSDSSSLSENMDVEKDNNSNSDSSSLSENMDVEKDNNFNSDSSSLSENMDVEKDNDSNSNSSSFPETMDVDKDNDSNSNPSSLSKLDIDYSNIMDHLSKLDIEKIDNRNSKIELNGIFDKLISCIGRDSVSEEEKE